jgi:hypothetical protein
MRTVKVEITMAAFELGPLDRTIVLMHSPPLPLLWVAHTCGELIYEIVRYENDVVVYAYRGLHNAEATDVLPDWDLTLPVLPPVRHAYLARAAKRL